MIKGSHIVVPKIHNEEQAYILQNKDNRIVFVIPYLDDFSIIGTTDLEYKGDPRHVAIDETEIDYLIDIVNQHFVDQLDREDVVWTFSGVRPLCDDESNSPQAITRDYTLELEQELDQAPLLSIFGGKLTTYRKLSESAMKHLKPFFPQMGESWTATQALPGGNFSCSRKQLAESLQNRYPWLNDKQALRYVKQFGSYCYKMLADVSCIEDMGIQFADGVYQKEIDYVIAYEHVKTVEDFLWRRTKLGLYLTDEQQLQVKEYIDANAPSSNIVSFHKAG